MKTNNTDGTTCATSKDASLLSRCLVVLCCCFFFYNTILSNNGLLLACLRNMRDANSADIWVRDVKLPLLLYACAGGCVFQFIQLVRKKNNLKEVIIICLCYFYAFYLLFSINVSHID